MLQRCKEVRIACMLLFSEVMDSEILSEIFGRINRKRNES